MYGLRAFTSFFLIKNSSEMENNAKQVLWKYPSARIFFDQIENLF